MARRTGICNTILTWRKRSTTRSTPSTRLQDPHPASSSPPSIPVRDEERHHEIQHDPAAQRHCNVAGIRCASPGQRWCASHRSGRRPGGRHPCQPGKKSLDTKRNNTGISEAITAEDIGKFPSTNVAEALSQIPGVTLDRRFGQGERVSIDGTDPSLNLSFLDGHPLAQAIWLYGEQPSRGFDYTLLAPQILGRAEILKSSEARLTEGSLGGTVLMHTRQPLDLKVNEVAASIGYSDSDQASQDKPNAALLYSWKNAAETFGIAVSAQHYEERVDRRGMEVFGYVPARTFANAAGGVPADADVPNSINAAWFQQDRERDSAVVNLQLTPSDALEFNLSGLYINEKLRQLQPVDVQLSHLESRDGGRGGPARRRP
ncbi:TonB-dependent receptor plug domain-containing protein [Xanthomonas oryzae pv. oryzae]|nr:TonB-dependent receptor plug domain-containing protein [Xanthomonas oryzae pv. oryzae]